MSDQARSVCNSAGVIGDAILAACVFDVSVTGNPALAQTAAHVSRESTVTAVAGEPLKSRVFGSGLAVSGAVRSVQPVSYEFTPLSLAPGQYDVRIDAVGNGADYRFTATS